MIKFDFYNLYSIQQMQAKSEKPSKKQQKQQKIKQKQASKHKIKNKGKPLESQDDDFDDYDDINMNQLNQDKSADQLQELQVYFSIGEINEKYYHSLKTILLRYATITKLTNSQIADIVVENKNIGNVVIEDCEQDQQQDEEEEQQQEEEQQNFDDDQENVFSVLTILLSKSKVGKKIRQYIQKSAEKKNISKDIINIISQQSTNILVNQRLPNLPAFVVNSSHEVFKKDLLQLKKTNKAKYDEISSGYLVNASQVQYQGRQQLQHLIYSKFQDFQMCKRAKIWWLGQKNQTYKKKADMRNLYYVIKCEQYLKGVDNIKSYLQD